MDVRLTDVDGTKIVVKEPVHGVCSVRHSIFSIPIAVRPSLWTFQRILCWHFGLTILLQGPQFTYPGKCSVRDGVSFLAFQVWLGPAVRWCSCLLSHMSLLCDLPLEQGGRRWTCFDWAGCYSPLGVRPNNPLNQYCFSYYELVQVFWGMRFGRDDELPPLLCHVLARTPGK